MIEELACVTDVNGDRVYVEASSKSTCSSCSVSSGCGNTLMDRLFPSRSQRIRVISDISVEKGDQVIIGLHEDALLRGSFLVYFLPVTLMIFSSAAVSLLFPGVIDIWVVSSGLAGLMIGFAWIYYQSGKMMYDRRYQPVILRKAHSRS